MGPKRTISINDGFGLLQMVLKLIIKWCACENAGSQRGWIVRSRIDWRVERTIAYKGEPITQWCANEDAGSRKGWIVKFHIGWRVERSIAYKGVDISHW